METNNEKKFWRVFDCADCFASFSTADAAALMADELVQSEFTGVHIAYMDDTVFNEYCKTGKWPFVLTA